MNTPRHIAVIMDGNGRWAKQNHSPRIEGHRRGALAVRKIVEAARKKEIRYLTLFSFSTENWNRSEHEVSSLMKLFLQYLKSETDSLKKNGIRLRAVGDLSLLPEALSLELKRSLELTAGCQGMDLVLAISYGGREEIINAAKNLAKKAQLGEIDPEQIDKQMFSQALWTADIPDPDLLIRTSGEKRISNFLLWQLAYTEIVIAKELWPDFDEKSFEDCIAEYLGRERRYGLTSEQIIENKNQALRV